MKPNRFVSRPSVITSFFLAFPMVAATHAASDSWDGSTDSLWATATNWLTDVSAPGAGETATFNSAGNGNTTIDLGAGVTLGALVFDPSAAAYTIGSGAVGSQTLTLGTTGNAITMNAGVATNQTINSNLSLTVTRTAGNPATYYAVTNNSTTNPLTLAGGISASTAGVKVLNPTGSGNTAISGAIASGSGNMSLFKTGTGTLTLSGGATFSGNGVTDGANFASSAVFREGTTILNGGTYNNSIGELVIGGVATHGGAGTSTTLQLDNGASLTGMNWLSIGRGNGTGTATSNLTLNGTSSVSAERMSAGYNAGNAGNLPKGAITLNDTATLSVTTGETAERFMLGQSAGSDFTMTVNGSAVVNRNAGSTGLGDQGQGALQIGREGKGTVIMNGGTINANSTDLGRGVNNATAQNGTLTIKTGAIYNNEGDFRTSFAGGASGEATLNLQGGTLNIGSTTQRTLFVGCWDLSKSTINIDSGNLNLNANSNIRFNQRSNSAVKVINLNGGAITSYSDNQTTPLGAGVLDLRLSGDNTASNNTFNLNGGMLTIRQVTSSTNIGTRTFNFNGGTLKATGDTAAFFNLGTGTARANVRNGGAVINTNGFTVTLGQALLHSDIGGDNAIDGGLTKQGVGTLTLAGTSSYTGATTVSAGALNVTGDIATSALSLGAATLSGNGFVGPVTVNHSAAVVSNGNANTDTLTVDALAFTTTGAANLNLSGGFNPAIAVTNNLNIGAGFTVNATSASAWNNGQTYDLIAYGSLTGSPASITKGTIAGLGARQNATLGNSGSAITLAISGDTPVWTGAQSNAWTTAVIGGLKNWKLQNAGTPTDFLNNDQVVFNDSATGTTDINISTANVQVASVAFNNSGVANLGRDYTISSSGGFGIANGSGSANLTKDGAGTVTLKTINSYTGSTTINDGTLQLGDGTTDGDIAASSSIINNGVLVFDRVGSFTYGNVISGSGEVAKNGSGTQILTADNTMSGFTTINAGTLQVGNGGTTGSLGTSPVTNDASLVINRSNAFTMGAFISGSGSVSQAGTGALTLSGNNSYSGGTTISPGSTVLVGANNALGSGTVTLAQGAVLGTNPGGALPNAIVAPASTTATLTTSGGNLTLNGNLSGSGNLNRTATGNAATVFLGGDNSGYTGTFSIENNGNAATRFTSANAGSAAARWVNSNPTSGRVTVEFGGGTIHFGSLTGTGFFTSQAAGTNTIEVGALGLNETYSGVLNQVGVGTLAVTKVGSGTWTLTGTNAYAGDTTVNGGVLAVDGDAIPNAGKLVVNGGKVDPTGVEVVDTLFFGAVQQAAGTWGSSASSATNKDDAHFSGTGVVSVTTGPVAGYTAWADANAPGQTMDQDHDGDGVANGIEYFMGLSGSAFTANPAVVGGTVTWPMGAAYAGVYGTDYKVQTSTTLVTWDDVLSGSVTIVPGSSVAYTLPGGTKLFVRLVVNN